MRGLWEAHIDFTRNYMVSDLADLPDTAALSARLMRNQDDIGAAFSPYYGAKAGKRLAVLLREHIRIATEVMSAAKFGDAPGLGSAQRKWEANGRDLVAFFAGVNPRWRVPEIGEMLAKHLELTTGELNSRLQKDWSGDIGYCDRLHEHMMLFCDTLSQGIVEQFPGKFSPVLTP